MKYTIKQIAEMFGVTSMAVRHWIKDKNIPYEYERVIGVKPRIILRIDDVKKSLSISRIS